MKTNVCYVAFLWVLSISALSAEVVDIAEQQKANAEYRQIENKIRESEDRYSEYLSEILKSIFDEFYHDLKSSGVAFDNAMNIAKETQRFLDVYLSESINKRSTDIYAFEQIDSDFYIKFLARNIGLTKVYRGFAFKESPAVFGMTGGMVRFSDPCVCSIAVREHYPRSGYISLWGTANAEINVPCSEIESGAARETVYNFIKSRASELLNTEYLL